MPVRRKLASFYACPVIALLVVANLLSSPHRKRNVIISEVLDEEGWHALKQIPHGKGWNQQDTEVLRSISLPRWQATAARGEDGAPSKVDRLGDVWLPPRLPIADDLRTLEYGVLFCGTGQTRFAENSMLPMIRHLRETLGIPDARERAALRERGGVHSGGGRQGFALVAKREFVDGDGPLRDTIPFFDAVYFVEDLPAYPFDWQNETGPSSITKATKVHAMSSAPFDTTIMLDFDSFPCLQDFALPLLEIFDNSDIGFTNVANVMEKVTDSRHFQAKHNSAIVILNMKSIRTRVLLALYLQAFHRQGELRAGKNFDSRGHRDQPALKVALQAMVESFQPKDSKLRGIPNDSVRDVIDQHELGFIRHSDFNSSLVCRAHTSRGKKVECSPDNLCVVAHKGRGIISRLIAPPPSN